MATPYIQVRLDTAPSTQDLARGWMRDLPVLVIASRQTAGRGRSGAAWDNAPRGLAVSLAFEAPPTDARPFSLMAGVAAARATSGFRLKWPNDLMAGSDKAGGILVERSGSCVVVGFGLNLWWPDPPEGYRALWNEDPGPSRHLEIGSLWGAELMRLVSSPGWPRDEYVRLCSTLGREISWEPDGRGLALEVDQEGGLVVETSTGRRVLNSGAVRHVR